MLMKPSKIMMSMKLFIMLILLISTLFFQKKTQALQSLPWLGLSHKPSFSILKKDSLFFTSLLKILALLSIMPLMVKTSLSSPDIIMLLKKWIPKKSSNLAIKFHFDLSFKMFLSMALLVSWSILEFSSYYMNNDPNPKQFFRLLIMFLLNMIILTSSNKIFILFMGWEGVGFLSFLLISWWSSRTKANNSAMQAIIYNRMGDMGLLLFFSLSMSYFKSWSISEMQTINSKTMKTKLLLLGALMAAAGKSAQFGLHPWLPAAMEGPTPVSALLHSSTMVVAGMFLLIRLSPLYSHSTMFKTWCLMIGSLTAIFAATTAMSQHDMKKIIAYSTTSQLGLMMVAIGLNQPKMALFHMCTHAFFKAMLFLSSGSIIHSLNDEQDMRKMGGLQFILPKTSACIVLGSLALSGIPFLAGFYSKDLMLEMSLTSMSNLTSIILALMATLLTSVYSFRIILFCFLKKPSFSPLCPTTEENPNLTKSLKRLAIGTILSGWILSKLILFSPTLKMPLMLKSLALILTLTGMMFSISMMKKLSITVLSKYFSSMNTFTSKQWFYEKLSHMIFLLHSFMMSLSLSTRKLDRGWSENMGPQGLTQSSYLTSQKYQLSQSGYMKQYMLLSTLTFLIMMSTTFILT